ncbi:959ac9da-e21d-41b7-9405-bc10fda23ee6 [Thermothielavioides terrestris]|nr:959ac9da-e21d-41b7-9405-bc10fda23ee6 [Thermothielavioides terrestris]
MRAAERGVSPLRQSRSAPKAEEATPRRRKVSVGAIDFAQRRETIKLAYSKSIRESQAREARQAAAERRKKELAAVARAKAEAEAATAAAVANAAAAASMAPPPKKPGGGSRRPSATVAEEKPGPVAAHETAAELSKEAAAELSKEAAAELSKEAAAELSKETAAELSTPKPPAEASPAPIESLKLEIPGSFPNAESPVLDQNHGEIPLSAVSATSAVTEFDTEVQTEPPMQENTATADDAPGPVAPSSAQATPESEAPEQAAPPSLHKRASYRSPFDEDDDANDSASIRISLDTSAPQPEPSPELTPTRTTFEPAPGPESAAIPPPAEDDDDEYVPRPYTFSSENYGTTVTILGPENDFKPLRKESSCATLPSPALPQADEPPTRSVPEIIASGASHQEDTKFGDLDRLEEFYIGSRLRDDVAVLRDSAFAGSDPTTPLDDQHSVAENQGTPDRSQSLVVPELLPPGNRLSQHSAWTDYSFASEERDAGHPSSTSTPHEVDAREDGTSFRLIPSAGDLSTCASSLGDLTESLAVSPLDSSGAPPSPMLPDFSGSHQHISAFATVNNNFTAHDESEPGSIAPLPDRAPPLPPPSERGYERDSTLYLAQSRPDSYAYSEDGKGDLSEAVSAPQSVSHARLDSVEPSRVSLSETLFEKQAPLTEEEQEEQKRLRQRQLVIRELIDTEDAFVRDMTVVEEIYKGTAEACPNLDSKTIKLIFRNTDEIIAFHAALLAEFKEGASTVYTPKGRRSPLPTSDAKDSDSVTLNSVVSSNRPERDDEKDRLTALGVVFTKNIEQLKAVHEVYLRSSDQSSKRLVQIQEDKTVMLWLNECNEVAKELTTAWNLDSLLIKPMQRITKYPDIITHLLKYTPEDHPDREPLTKARTAVIEAIDEINRTKKNYELVGQIVSNRKRKETDVRAGLARAFGKRVDKLQVSGSKTAEDEEYQKLQQQFGDDYLRLQVVLRDVEYYARNVATYVHEFLQYLSSMELVMRLQPSRDYAHLESKWVQFNVSMRDMEKIALEKHLADVRKHVIEPFEQVIRCYGNPSLAMKKRAKRRLDYERYMALKANGKKVDKQLAELVEQYEALNDTLKKELPKLSAMTAKVGNICLGKFISIQAAWYAIWKEKVKAPLHDATHVPEPSEIVSSFQREFALQEERAMALSILNPTLRSRPSQSTTDDASSILSKSRSRPSDIHSPRSRGLSINSDYVPSLPTPDFAKRNSGQFSLSPASSALPSPANYYRDYYSGINGNGRGGSGSPITPVDLSSGSRGPMAGAPPMRPSTGRSFDSTSLPRQSSDSAAGGGFGPLPEQQQTRRLSGLFSSALPLPDGPEDSVRSSRASSRERGGDGGRGTYNVLWLAASLFEFNIETTKHEAGYPYLTYQAGEIFDVIAEKGELWLAKNQDDPHDVVGWIWSKHFAKLADS